MINYARVAAEKNYIMTTIRLSYMTYMNTCRTSSPCLLEELKNFRRTAAIYLCIIAPTFSGKLSHKTWREHSNSVSSFSVPHPQLQWTRFLIWLVGIYCLISLHQTIVVIFMIGAFWYSLFPACAYLKEMRAMDEVEIEKLLCTTENVRFPKMLESKKA